MRLGELVYLITGDDRPLKKQLDAAKRAVEQNATDAAKASAKGSAEIAYATEKSIRNVANASKNASHEVDKVASQSAEAIKAKLDSRLVQLKSFGNAMSTAVTLPLAGLGVAALNAASDVDEAATTAKKVFGEYFKEVERFARTSAETIGASRSEVYQYASQVGSILKASGFKGEIAEMSNQIVQLAADIGSFKNISLEDAFSKLRSGLAGEAEPLRTVGILLSESAVNAQLAADGVEKVNGQFTESDRIAARYKVILGQSKDMLGDFGRTADGVANSKKTVNAMIKSMSEEFGESMVPALKDVLKELKSVLSWFYNLDDAKKKLAIWVTGIVALVGPASRTIAAILGLVRAWQAVTVAAEAAAVAQTAAAGGSAAGGVAGMLAKYPALALLARGGPVAAGALAAGAAGYGLGSASKPTWEAERVTKDGVVADPRLVSTFAAVASRLQELKRSSMSAKDAVAQLKRELSDDIFGSKFGGKLSASEIQAALKFASGVPMPSNDATSILLGRSGAPDFTTLATAYVKQLLNGASSVLQKPSGVPAPNRRAGNVDTGGSGGNGGGSPLEVLGVSREQIISMAKDVNVTIAMSCAQSARKIAAMWTQGFLADDPSLDSAAKLEAAVIARGAKRIPLSQAKPGDMIFTAGSGPSGRHAMTSLGGYWAVDTNGRPSGKLLDPNGTRFGAADDVRLQDVRGRSGVSVYRIPDQYKLPSNLVGNIKEFVDVLPLATKELSAWQSAFKDARSQLADQMAEYRRKFMDPMDATSDRLFGKPFDQLTSQQNRNLVTEMVVSQKIFSSAEKTLQDLPRKMSTAVLALMNPLLLVRSATPSPEQPSIDLHGGGLYGTISKIGREEIQDRLSRYNQKMRELAKSLAVLAQSSESAARYQELLNEGWSPSEAGKIQSMESQIEQHRATLQKLESDATRYTDAIMGVIDDVKRNGFDSLFRSIGAGFSRLLDEMASEMLRAEVWRLVRGMLGSAGSPSANPFAFAAAMPGPMGSVLASAGVIGQALMNAGRGRASGGPVRAGESYWVGEREPEMFVPSRDGYILPRSRMGGAVNVTVNIHTPDIAGFRQSEGQVAAAAVRAAEEARRRLRG